MKNKYFSIRAALVATATCGAIMIPSLSYAVGGVSVNGNAVCSSSTNMSLNPAGDIVISCTAPGVPPTNTAPACTVNVSPSSISTGQSSTITAVCSPAATSWLWATNGPAISGSGGTVSFATAGSFTYTVTASNGAGSGAPAANTVVVTTGGGPIGGGNCVPSAVAGAYAANSTKLIAIDRGAKVAYALPIYNGAGRTLEILSIQSTASQSDLTSEFSVSTCPGDFDNMQAECKTWGIVNQSGTQLYATTSGSQVNGTCTVVLGQQYYLNVRNTKFDRVSPACTPQTCYMNVQLNSY